MVTTTWVYVRWLIRRDMEEILAIENTHQHPWIESDILCCLRQRNCIGMVAECHGVVSGWMLYELHKCYLELLNFRIHPNSSMDAVGHPMIHNMRSKLSHHRRTSIQITVRESDLSLLLFLKSERFVAENLLRGYFDQQEDGILMVYDLIQ